LAVLLDWPAVTYVSKIETEEGKLGAERKFDDGIEVVEVELPAVMTVTGESNRPRIPGLKQVMQAKKKPMQNWGLAELAIKKRTYSLMFA